MYKVRKVRNQPHFGIYKNGKLHSTHPTKRLAKKMMGGMVGDEYEPKYIEPIIKSPRSIPNHAVALVNDAEEIPIEPITEDADEPVFAYATPKDVDYPTVHDVMDTAQRMLKHYGENDHIVPLDIEHIQTNFVTSGPQLSEYTPTTKKDILRYKERLSEHLAEYMDLISDYDPEDQAERLQMVEAISKHSLNELKQIARNLHEKIFDNPQIVSKSGNETHVNYLDYLPYDYEEGYYDIHPHDFKFNSQILSEGYKMLEDPEFMEYLIRREQKQNYGRYDTSRPYVEQRHEMEWRPDPEHPGYFEQVPVNPYLYYQGDIFKDMTLKGLQKLYYDYLKDRTIAFNALYPQSTTPYHTQSARKVIERNKQLYRQLLAPLKSEYVDSVTKKNEDVLQRAKYKVFLSKNKEGQKGYVKAHKEEFEEKAKPHLEERRRKPKDKKQREKAHEKGLKELLSKGEAFEESKESEPPDETVQRYHPEIYAPRSISDKTVYRQPQLEQRKRNPEAKQKQRERAKSKPKGTPM